METLLEYFYIQTLGTPRFRPQMIAEWWFKCLKMVHEITSQNWERCNNDVRVQKITHSTHEWNQTLQRALCGFHLCHFKSTGTLPSSPPPRIVILLLTRADDVKSDVCSWNMDDYFSVLRWENYAQEHTFLNRTRFVEIDCPLWKETHRSIFLKGAATGVDTSRRQNIITLKGYCCNSKVRHTILSTRKITQINCSIPRQPPQYRAETLILICKHII